MKQSQTTPKRYSLDELLEGCTPENIQNLNNETSWALEGTYIGQELLFLEDGELPT